MKYVPILRYRQEERKSLLNVAFSSKTVPLVEIVTSKLRSTSTKTIFEQFKEDLPRISEWVLIDFPTYIPMKNGTNPQVASFLRPILANHALRTQLFSSLRGSNITPVVTYNASLSHYIPNTVTAEATRLRTLFQRLAFRIFVNHSTSALAEIRQVIQRGDVVILDLGENAHTTPSFQRLYKNIGSLKEFDVKTVIARSAIPASVTNVGLNSGQIIESADNSLLTAYSTYGFDALGDYAGLKRDELPGGGTISPGFIYFSWEDNSYYGYNSPIKKLSEFEQTIIPQVLNSTAWRQYSPAHHTTCAGCKEILAIHNETVSGQNQARWKGITCSHYLNTLEEFL